MAIKCKLPRDRRRIQHEYNAHSTRSDWSFASQVLGIDSCMEEADRVNDASLATTPPPNIKNKVYQRSIVCGSIATPIKKPEGDHTHKWTVYVRGAHDEDISSYIKRVVFRLHESFPNPSRCTSDILPCSFNQMQR